MSFTFKRGTDAKAGPVRTYSSLKRIPQVAKKSTIIAPTSDNSLVKEDAMPSTSTSNSTATPGKSTATPGNNKSASSLAEWTLIPIRRPLTPPRPSIDTPSPVPLSNPYEVLSSVYNDENSVVDLNQVNDKDDVEATPTTTFIRPPPIVVYHFGEYHMLLQFIKPLCSADFTITPGQTSYKIHLTTMEDYNMVTSALKGKNCQFHTFATNKITTNKHVLRGLPVSMAPDELKDDLILDGYEVTTVVQLTKPGLQPGERIPMPLFAVTTLAGNSASARAGNINEITRVGYIKVRVEHYRGQKLPQMCFNCQRFGHAAIFCGHPPRCYKCAGAHNGQACLKPVTTPALCANCNGPHPSCSRKCEVYKQAIARHRNSSGKKQVNRLGKETSQNDRRPTNEKPSVFITAPAPPPLERSFAQAVTTPEALDVAHPISSKTMLQQHQQHQPEQHQWQQHQMQPEQQQQQSNHWNHQQQPQQWQFQQQQQHWPAQNVNQGPFESPWHTVLQLARAIARHCPNNPVIRHMAGLLEVFAAEQTQTQTQHGV
jgi:hypothetical protein